jgi:hypothetical protein
LPLHQASAAQAVAPCASAAAGMLLPGTEAMIEAMSPVGVWLLQQAVAQHDTNYTIQLPSVPSAFDRVAGVAGGLLTIAFLRLHQAVALSERRLNEFNALLEVVQQEAEQMFVSTASAVRGVRTTASAFAGASGRDGSNLASSTVDDLDRLGADEEIALETEYEETIDGYDRIAAPSENDAARPRVRPRSRRRDWT